MGELAALMALGEVQVGALATMDQRMELALQKVHGHDQFKVRRLSVALVLCGTDSLCNTACPCPRGWLCNTACPCPRDWLCQSAALFVTGSLSLSLAFPVPGSQSRTHSAPF